MRIAQFTSSLVEPLGGAEQYCLALARQQAREGHDVTVVTGWADRSVLAALSADGIATLVVPSRRPYSPDGTGPSLAARLEFHARELVDSFRRTAATRALEAGGYDVVHVHRFAGFGTSVLRPRGTRVVHTVHDYSLVDTSASLVRDGELLDAPAGVQQARTRAMARGIPTSTTLVFPSERTRATHDAWGFDTDAFDSHVIPHGWRSPVDRPAAVPRGDGPLRVLFLGKLADHKGVPMLLEAWGDGVPGAELRVAGDGPLTDAVHDAAVRTAVAAARSSVAEGRCVDQAPRGVVPLGWLDDAARAAALADTDVLVVPSRWPENFPIVVAEAVLAGVPILTTTVAAPPLVDDGQTGLLVEATAAALRDGVIRLATDQVLRARLAAGVRARAGLLDMDVHGASLMAAYGIGHRTPRPIPGSARPAVRTAHEQEVRFL